MEAKQDLLTRMSDEEWENLMNNSANIVEDSMEWEEKSRQFEAAFSGKQRKKKGQVCVSKNLIQVPYQYIYLRKIHRIKLPYLTIYWKVVILSLYRYFIALREIYRNVCPEVPGNPRDVIFPDAFGVGKYNILEIPRNRRTNVLVYFPRSNEITVLLYFTRENAWKIDPKF